MPGEVKITTELLLRGMLLFALVDVIYVPLLAWRLRRDFFLRLKWPLTVAAACIWFGIWRWAIGNFWETVYRYVFPAWGQTWIPFIALVVAGLAGLGLWALAVRLKWNPALGVCPSGASIRDMDKKSSAEMESCPRCLPVRRSARDSDSPLGGLPWRGQQTTDVTGRIAGGGG